MGVVPEGSHRHWKTTTSATTATATATTTANSSESTTNMARRIGSMLSSKRAKARQGGHLDAGTSVVDDNDNATFHSGDKSVALTVSSQVTVKASNRVVKRTSKQSSASSSSSSSKGGGWMSLRRLVGATSSSHPHPQQQQQHQHQQLPPLAAQRGHSRSEDFSSAGSIGKSIRQIVRNRILSEDDSKCSSSSNTASARVKAEMDLAIRGRLDGIDCLSLGPASKTTLSRASRARDAKAKAKKKTRTSTILNIDPSKTSFTGAPISRKPADLVSDMMWASGGKECPELIFEGYLPGGADRWTVRLGRTAAAASAAGVQSGTRTAKTGTVRWTPSVEGEDDSTAELTEDGSTNMPAHMLWDHIWGAQPSPPVPAYMQSGSGKDEDVMQLVASCSVPVDLDDDTFIIDSPEHFCSVHDVAVVPIQSRRFDAALSIFDKMLKGLEEQAKDCFEHLQACTHHNMGIIWMCQSNFKRAAERFESAVEIRSRCLPLNHPDMVVSLVRRGQAYFALENYKKALESFQLALNMSPIEDAARAKMLNNIGVVYFQQENFAEALASFTSALEIQRQWLDGPIRRESMVYDASLTLGNMGNVFLELGDYEVAYSVFEEACLLQTTTFRKGHDLLLASLENLSVTQLNSGEYDKATPILRGLLRTKEARFGSDHRSTIETMGMLSFAVIQLGELEEAYGLLRKVAEWQKENMSHSHPAVKMTKEALSSIAMLIDGI